VRHSRPRAVLEALFLSRRACSRSIRTSSGMFLRRGQDAIIQRLEERIASFAMVPAGASALSQPHSRARGAGR
jgi:hypothetical protein